jgi:hypothetical protein
VVWICFKAVQSAFIGICYAACDCKGSDEDLDAGYLFDNWTDIDTVALILTFLIGIAYYTVFIEKGSFSWILHVTIPRYGMFAAGGVMFIVLIVLCAVVDEESAAYWALIFALVLVMELAVTPGVYFAHKFFKSLPARMPKRDPKTSGRSGTGDSKEQGKSDRSGKGKNRDRESGRKSGSSRKK